MRMTHSLRGRLLWFLLAAITLAALAQASIAYNTALSDADQIFDYHMQQMALSLRSGTPLSNTEARERLDEAPGNDDLVVQMWSPDGVQVFHSVSRARLPQRAVLGFSNVKANGTTYRVFSIQTSGQTVQVAQDLAVRRNMAGNLALRTLGPTAVMMPILMLVVWWVVSGSLQPVARVRKQVAARQADDLSPVSEAGLPDEVRPLVHELNLLFGRVKTAFDAQQNFVADAAHELRTPLAGLHMHVQLLGRQHPDMAGPFLKLRQDIARLTALVDSLLTLARLDPLAREQLVRQQVLLAPLLEGVLALHAPQAERRGIALALHCELETVQGDPRMLEIMLRNLVENALRYCPEGSRVEIAAGWHEGRQRIAVRDNGPGVDEASRARLTERFFRVLGQGQEGSGLGLSIVRRIAELHGIALGFGVGLEGRGLGVTLDLPAP